MTQKGDLFKGQQKKSVSANRHGKDISIRKGKVFKAPIKKTKDDEMNKEIEKFIKQANESRTAAVATKEGARLRLVKAPEAEPNSKNAKTSKAQKKLGLK